MRLVEVYKIDELQIESQKKAVKNFMENSVYYKNERERRLKAFEERTREECSKKIFSKYNTYLNSRFSNETELNFLLNVVYDNDIPNKFYYLVQYGLIEYITICGLKEQEQEKVHIEHHSPKKQSFLVFETVLDLKKDLIAWTEKTVEEISTKINDYEKTLDYDFAFQLLKELDYEFLEDGMQF